MLQPAKYGHQRTPLNSVKERGPTELYALNYLSTVALREGGTTLNSSLLGNVKCLGRGAALRPLDLTLFVFAGDRLTPDICSPSLKNGVFLDEHGIR